MISWTFEPDEDHASDPRSLPASVRHDYQTVASWAGKYAGRSVAVVCTRGLKLSQGVAAWLRHAGAKAEYLEGGFDAWKEGKGLLLRPNHVPPRDSEGRTVWVTRTRPKIDRIACPWLIRRFVDPDAIFLFVAPSEVEAVAERFGATPFDIEGIFWSHRADLCTFDVMIEEFGLHADALDRLALIVRAADTARLDLAPQAAGLLAASLGLSRMHRDDLVQLDASFLALRRFLSLGAGCGRRKPQLADSGRRWPGMSATVTRTAAIPPDEIAPAHGVSFAEAFKVWLRVALLSFGGPAGQIAVMHRIVVEERRWISEARFLHALNYCHLLPGPEAQQLAIYIGWLMHKTRGGLVAGILFVVPGVIALMALSWIYVVWGNLGFVAGLFFGLKAAVLAVVVEAVLRVGRRALKSQLAVVIAAVAFVALFLFAVPFPLVVLAAALIGFAANRLGYAMGGTPPTERTMIYWVRACPITLVHRLRGRSRSSRPGCRCGLARLRCCFCFSAPTTSSRGSRCSSARSPYSVSAALMRCSPMSRSKPSKHITGFSPARC